MDNTSPPPPRPPAVPIPQPNNNNKPDRKTVEKNRRDQMKLLYSSLDSLITSASPSSASASAPFSGQQLPDRIDEATSYIKKAQERIERLKEKKRQLMITTAGSSSSGGASATRTNKRSRSPQIEVRDLGSGLNAVLIICSGDDRSIMHKSIRAVEEGGAKVLNAHYTSVGDKSILSLHTLAGDTKESGSVTGSILDRLKSAFSIRNSNT